MAVWMRVEGFRPPTQNGGWFELKMFSWALGQRRPGPGGFQGVVAFDAFSQQIVEETLRGAGVPKVVVFIDPQSEITFTRCHSTDYSMGSDHDTIHFAVSFESSTTRYSGSP